MLRFERMTIQSSLKESIKHDVFAMRFGHVLMTKKLFLS